MAALEKLCILMSQNLQFPDPLQTHVHKLEVEVCFLLLNHWAS